VLLDLVVEDTGLLAAEEDQLELEGHQEKVVDLVVLLLGVEMVLV
jgi:hypothetical protein